MIIKLKEPLPNNQSSDIVFDIHTEDFYHYFAEPKPILRRLSPTETIGLKQGFTIDTSELCLLTS